MAAGEGPRDWQQDDAYAFPNAPGGADVARPRSPRRSAIGTGIVVAVILVVVIVAALVPRATTVNASGSVNAPVSQPVPPRPVRVTYPTAAAERSALLRSVPQIAGTLTQIAHSGGPMPTSFSLSISGGLLAEPSGQLLGPLAYGDTIEWAADPDGRVTTLTLVGSTFGTRIPLGLGAISPPAPPSSTA
jgi:hypothetical protein